MTEQELYNEYQKSDCKSFTDFLINKITELEKENAELKEGGSVICDRLSERIDETVELKNENIGLKNQLTKATEIIKKLIEAIHIWDCKNLEEVEAEAEQFISEVEK